MRLLDGKAPIQKRVVPLKNRAQRRLEAQRAATLLKTKGVVFFRLGSGNSRGLVSPIYMEWDNRKFQ